MWEDPRLYNTASSLVAGILILVWTVRTMRVRRSQEESQFALAAMLFTSDIPLAVLAMWARRLSVSASTLAGKLMTVLVLRPTPMILLATGCFYLWIFLRYKPAAPCTPGAQDTTNRSPIETAAG